MNSWNTPTLLVYANHAVTKTAIREIIRLDRTLRKLKSALSRGEITAQAFEEAASNLRSALSRFMERVHDLDHSTFPEVRNDS